MSFADPAALWALAAVALPVLMHLFNRSRGRPLPFADIRFIPAAQARRLRRLMVSQWPLLLLRCLLVALLALLLAGPRWQSGGRLDVSSAVLLSPLALRSGGEQTLAEARGIAAERGAVLRLLLPGFPEPALGPAVNAATAAWSLLADLEAQIAADTRLLLLVADDPAESPWRRPALARPVEWQVIGPPVPRPTLRVALEAAPARAEDARFLNAALRALAAGGMDLELGFDPASAGSRRADVVFALGEVGEIAPRPGQTLIRDTARPLSARSQEVHHFAGERFDVSLTAGAKPEAATLLATRSGKPLASSRQINGGARIQWHSRFHPRHAAVAGSAYFPDLVASLLDTAIQGGPVERRQSGNEDIRWLLGLLLVLAWILERVYARYRAGNRGDG